MATLTIISHLPAEILGFPVCEGADTFPGQGVYEWITDPPDLAVDYRVDGGEWTPGEQPLSLDLSDGNEHQVEFRINPDELGRDSIPDPITEDFVTTYAIGDIVSRYDVMYICTNPTQDAPPSADWDTYTPPTWQEGIVYHDGDIVRVP